MRPEYGLKCPKKKQCCGTERKGKGCQLTEQCDIEGTKRKNIVDMALGFTAMMRIFSEGSKVKIQSKLEQVFSRLDKIMSRDDYEACHRSFCDWFTREIWCAEKNLRNGKIQRAKLRRTAKPPRCWTLRRRSTFTTAVSPQRTLRDESCLSFTARSTHQLWST